VAFSYAFGGLSIDSELPLPRLWTEGRAVRPPCDVALSRAGPVRPAGARQLFVWPGRYGMSLWAQDDGWTFRSAALDIDVFVSADGRRLQWRSDGPDLNGVSEFLIRRVLPRLALLHGRLTLHAAAVRGANGCLLLSGPTGAGKSTLSAALAMTGAWRLLSDDVSILAAEEPRVWPSGPGAYLTPTSVSGLGIDPTAGGADPSRSGKAWFEAGEAVDAPLPVAGLVFLNRTAPQTAARLSPITRHDALNRAWRQVLRFNPTDRREAARLFELVSRLVWRVPAHQLDYPADYGALPSVDAELRRTWKPQIAA
jgi:hypothetical protein